MMFGEKGGFTLGPSRRTFWLCLLNPDIRDGLVTYYGRLFIEEGLIATASIEEFDGWLFAHRYGDCSRESGKARLAKLRARQG